MSLNINTAYAGQVTAPETNYPYGSAKNETSEQDNDGLPYEKQFIDDFIIGIKAAILRAAGLDLADLDGVVDNAVSSQYMSSLVELMMGRAMTVVDSGSADNYVLSPATNQHPPNDIFDGMRLVFVALQPSTGASTVNAFGTGVKSLVNRDGSAIGENNVSGRTEIYYDETNDRYVLDNAAAAPAAVAGFNAASARYVVSDFPTDSTGSISVNEDLTEDTWVSIGPTGSGADFIWTALDAIPLSATMLDLRIRSTINVSGGPDYNAAMYARAAGSSNTAINSATAIHVNQIDTDGTANLSTLQFSTPTVPLNAANVFEVQWRVNRTIIPQTTFWNMYAHGFGI